MAHPKTAGTNLARLQIFVFGLFFIFGGITSLNDVVIPKLKALFTLSYADAMLVQSAFFAAYFLISLPAAIVVRKFGYMRTAVIGLAVMTLGCLLFIPASSSGLFGMFLFALFILAAGITIVQVVANPLISMLGDASTASSRLTFAQAFNSLGTTLFPYVGSVLILGGAQTASTRVIKLTYVGIAVTLALVALAVWLERKQLKEAAAETTPILDAFNLLKRLRFAWGTLCIFLYVGAEVSIGSLLVVYLMQSSVLGFAAEAAGKCVPFYWGGAMVGRFIGAYLLRVFSPGKVLAGVACGAILLLLASASAGGWAAGGTILAIGLCNSIMFPTIFSLASEGLGRRAAEGSGIICMAIVGGAVVPLLTGTLADHTSLRLALAIPGICYAVILAFGWFAAANPVASGPRRVEA